MISATVKAGDSGTQYLEVPASELQSNIVIDDKFETIAGVLHKKDDFVAFNPSAPEEQSGHYLVLTLTPLEEATIKTKIIGGTKPEVTVDDGFCVYRITDSEKQMIEVSTDKAGDVKKKTYDLRRLILEEG